MTCEKNFDEGIKIYEAIVKKKLLETTQSQIDSMDKLTEKLNTVTEKVPEPAENKALDELKEKEKEKENETDKSANEKVLNEPKEIEKTDDIPKEIEKTDDKTIVVKNEIQQVL